MAALKLLVLMTLLAVAAPAAAQDLAAWQAQRSAAFQAFRAKPPVGEAWDAIEAPQMVLVPAGRFAMGPKPGQAGLRGNELPRHQVSIAKPLLVAKYPVTVGEFAAFAAATGHDAGAQCWTFEEEDGRIRQGRSWTNPGFVQAPSHPVLCVSMAEVNAYIAWLNARTATVTAAHRGRI